MAKSNILRIFFCGHNINYDLDWFLSTLYVVAYDVWTHLNFKIFCKSRNVVASWC